MTHDVWIAAMNERKKNGLIPPLSHRVGRREESHGDLFTQKCRKSFARLCSKKSSGPKRVKLKLEPREVNMNLTEVSRRKWPQHKTEHKENELKWDRTKCSMYATNRNQCTASNALAIIYDAIHMKQKLRVLMYLFADVCTMWMWVAEGQKFKVSQKERRTKNYNVYSLEDSWGLLSQQTCSSQWVRRLNALQSLSPR